MKRFVFITILLCLLTMSVFAYRVLDKRDPVDVLHITESLGTHVWVEYDNFQEAVDDHVTQGAAAAADIILFYNPRYSPTSITHFLRIDINSEGFYFNVDWDYIKYGRVNFVDHPEDILSETAHPPYYSDFIGLMGDEGWLDLDDIQGSPIFLSTVDKIQERVSYGRIHWGLDIAPENRPNSHEIGVALKGGDWVQFGDGNYEYYIARVDLTGAQNSRDPDISAAFRHQTERRTIIRYGINDIGVLLDFEPVLANLQEGEIHIDYSQDKVYLKLNSSLTVAASNNTPRFSFISVDPKGGADTEQEWYLARISHRAYNAQTGVLEFRCDSHEKKGEYQDHDMVYVQIQQN